MRLWFTSSDADLVKRALSDERDAFEELARRYQKKAYAIARGLGVRGSAVDDVVQEAFLNGFQNLGTLRAPASFGPWFLQILRNAAREHLLKQGTLPPRPERSLDQATPAESLEATDFHEYLWRKVMDLPEGVREVVFLYYHDGESTFRVARTLGIGRSVVKNRLVQGRDLLRERLWREMEDSFRDMLPSVRSWKRRGRCLALVAMLSIDPAALVRAKTVAAAGAGAGTSLHLIVGTVIVAASLAIFLGSRGFRDLSGGPDGATARVEQLSRVNVERSANRPGGEAALRVGEARTGFQGTIFLGARGTPAAGATVAAIPDGETRRAAESVAGPDGRFELAPLPPGSYRLWAWKETWTTDAPDRGMIRIREGELIAGIERILVTGTVVLGEVAAAGSGEPIAGASVGYARLQLARTTGDGRFRLEGVPLGSIRVAAMAPGFAWKSIEAQVTAGEEPFFRIELSPGGVIEGRVFAPDGAPAPHAGVRALSAGVFLEVRTDPEGRYRLEGIPIAERNIRVEASRGGLHKSVVELDGFPEGETRVELDLKLEAGFVLAGRTLDSRGEPLEGADLFVGDSSDRAATSGALGRFRIEGASEAMPEITAREKGYAPATRILREVPPSERESLVLALGPAHSVSGRVVDREENPLPGAWVYLDTGPDFAGPYPSTYTDQDGGFRFEDLPEALREIGALKSGFLDNRGSPVEPDREDVRLVLDEDGQIQGIVTGGDDREPVRSFTVRVELGAASLRAGRKETLSASMVRNGLRFGSSDGRFAIRQLDPHASYRLTFLADGYVESILEDVEAGPDSEAREPLQVVLKPGKPLDGQVVAAASGTPLDRVLATYRGHQGVGPAAARTASTNPEGRFTIGELPYETGSLILEKAGYGRMVVAGVRPDDHVQIFRLFEEAIVEGMATDAAGEPVSGASVEVWVGEEKIQSVPTDGEGRYRMDGLPAGDARIILSRAGSLSLTRQATLISGKRSLVDFREPTGEITGIVLLGRQPVPKAWIQLKGPDSERAEAIFAGDDGRFHVKALPPGTYFLEAQRPGDPRGSTRVAKGSVEVASGEVEIELAFSAARLSGRALDRSTGKPAAGGSVDLFCDAPALTAPRSIRPAGRWSHVERKPLGQDGSAFDFEALPAGRYYLAASLGEVAPTSGWLGPLEVADGAEITGLDLIAGAGEGPEVRVLDARSRRPIEGASLSALLDGGFKLRLGGATDASGRARFPDGLSGGSIEALANGYAPGTARIEGQGGAILLQPTARIVVRCAGKIPEGTLQLIASAISGDDPSWPFRSREDLPLGMGSRARAGAPAEFHLEAAPGRYRIRFELHVGPIRSPPVATKEIDIEAPPAGEVQVEMEVP